MRPRSLWVRCDAAESFWRRRLTAWFEVILAPLGWKTVLWTPALAVVLAGTCERCVQHLCLDAIR